MYVCAYIHIDVHLLGAHLCESTRQEKKTVALVEKKKNIFNLHMLHNKWFGGVKKM